MMPVWRPSEVCVSPFIQVKSWEWPAYREMGSENWLRSWPGNARR